jgi:predicted MFS family arabinose efflux permease
MIDQRWLILGVLFVARTSFGYQFQSLASSAALIEAELHIGYAVIGTLIGVYTIPGAFLSLPGGVLGARFGDRAVGATGLVLMIGGGLLTCAGDTLLPLTAGRLISGAGSVLFSLVLNKMIIDWFAGREIVFAMGTLLSSWPFGIALGLVVQGRIAESLGWRTGMAIAALFCLLALVLILVVYRPPPGAAGRTGGGNTWWNPPDWLSLRSVLIAATAWGCVNVGLIIMFSFVASLLAVRGMSMQDAASTTSIALWISIFSVPVGGYLLQRTARPRLLANLSYLAGGLALLALYLGIWPILACVAFGLVLGPCPGDLTAMPSRVLRPEHRITGLAIFATLNSALMGVGPMIAGILADAAHSPAPALLLGVAVVVACVPLTMLFEATLRHPFSTETSPTDRVA